mgnify:FL=1
MKDKVIHFQIEDGMLVLLTDTGRMFQKSMRTGGQWIEIPLPEFPTKKREIDEKEISWPITKS